MEEILMNWSKISKSDAVKGYSKLVKKQRETIKKR